jgi:hypothetical protein
MCKGERRKERRQRASHPNQNQKSQECLQTSPDIKKARQLDEDALIEIERHRLNDVRRPFKPRGGSGPKSWLIFFFLHSTPRTLNSVVFWWCSELFWVKMPRRVLIRHAYRVPVAMVYAYKCENHTRACVIAASQNPIWIFLAILR